MDNHHAIFQGAGFITHLPLLCDETTGGVRFTDAGPVPYIATEKPCVTASLLSQPTGVDLSRHNNGKHCYLSLKT